MNIFDNVYDVLFEPRAAFRRMTAERPLGQAVLVFLISVLVPAVPMYFTMDFAAGFVMGLEVIGGLLLWFLGAAVWGLVAELFGGHGQSSSLFTALGFAHIPRVFLVPGLMAASLLPSAVKPVLEVVLICGVLFWSMLLDIAAIRETYALSGAKAVLVLIMPLLFVLVIMIMAAIAAGTMMTYLPFSLNKVL